ncbi:S-layer homology domain-containing protein [Paenibacillus chungangensis]|uniref:S-layer homology domain-containing protein n=1 Tax=Paenibacillus chungangensis TaxID=696535 RepID=A0ABW3HU07_9BACL
MNNDAFLFKDSDSISTWALSEVNELKQRDFIQGRPDGAFDPHAYITRAEVIKMLDNAIQALYIQPGSYSEDLDGIAIVSGKDITLKDSIIRGSLLLAEGIGEADVNIVNMDVTEQVIVKGGGVQSVYVTGESNVTSLIAAKKHSPFRIQKDDQAIVERVELSSDSNDVILSGNYETVDMQSASTLLLPKGSKLKQVYMNKDGAVLSGDGNADMIYVLADNVHVNINGAKLVVDKNAEGTMVNGKEVGPGKQGITQSGGGIIEGTGYTPPYTGIDRTPSVFYVSPHGNDNNDGSLHRPFQTLQKASSAVRQVNDQMTGDITVYLRGGTYEMDAPLQLTEEDSGTNGYMVVYKAYPGEVPVISGGKKIEGWVPDDVNSNLYKAAVANIGQIRQLYVNGKRAQRAKSAGSFKDDSVYRYRSGQYVTRNNQISGYIVNTADLGGDLRNGDDMELVFNLGWRQHRVAVDGAEDNENGTTSLFVDPVRMNWALTLDAANNRPVLNKPFYVENAFGHLDEPGEWYYDEEDGYVYYYPLADEQIAKIEVIAPGEIESLISIEGSDRNSKASHIRLEGLTIRHSAWHKPSVEGAVIVQANFYVNQDGQGSHTDGGELAEAAVEMKNAEHIQFHGNRMEQLGGTGLKLADAVRDIAITGNWISDVSESAIVVGSWLHNFVRYG